MKNKIANLIQQHKLRRTECTEMLNEITQLGTSGMHFDERELIKNSIIELQLEMSLRKSFVDELENIITE